jgi:hypothetical protein
VSASICCRRSCKLGELCARGSPASAVGEVGEAGLLGLAAAGEGSGPSPFAAASGATAVEAPASFEEAIMVVQSTLGGTDAGM